jgi:filamentous hemagglutinin
MPLLGDVKAFVEANTKLEYALAAVGVLGPLGDAAKIAIKDAKILLEAGETTKAAEKVAEAQRSLEVNAGAKGAWNTALNKPEPNKIYRVNDRYDYHTDSLGRVEKVEGKLTLDLMDRNTYQQCVAGKCGNVGDEGGHLIASIMGGPGERLNLVPMDGNLNKGVWKKLENEWAAALKEGKQVQVRIEPAYNGNSVRPDRFTVTYQVGNERPIKKDFNNAPGGM